MSEVLSAHNGNGREDSLVHLGKEFPSEDLEYREVVRTAIESTYPAQTVPDFLTWIERSYEELPALKEARFNADAQEYSYETLREKVDNISKRLIAWGVLPGNRVGMVTENSPEQLMCNLAIQSIGAVVVPWTEDAKKNGGLSHQEIMEQAEVNFVFYGNKKLESSFSDADFAVASLDDFIREEQEEDSVSDQELWKRKSEVSPDDAALMIFSSGTGGGSLKLVELSHRNLMYIPMAALKKSDMHPEDKILEILPWHHIYQYATQYIALATGQELSVSTLESLTKSGGKILKDVSPDHVTAVPLAWEKVMNKANDGLKKQTQSVSGLKKFVLEGVQKAIALDSAKAVLGDLERNKGTEFEPQAEKYWESQKEIAHEVKEQFSGVLDWAQAAVGRTIGYPKLKEEMGLNNIHYIVNGGGTLSPVVAAWFQALGIDMKIGYGMSESAAMGTFGNPKKYESPFVSGETLPGIRAEVRKDEDGLDVIWLSGPMLGRYVDEELNKEAFDERGFYCTGDIGYVHDNPDGTQSLVVVGRKKSMIKLKGGEAILPEPIEAAIKNSLAVKDVFVDGTDVDSQLKAYLVLSWEHICEKFKDVTKDTFGNHKGVVEYMKAEVRRLAPNEMFGAIMGDIHLILEEFPEGVMSRSNKVIRSKLREWLRLLLKNRV
jgi:long-chain acyl-CoA synthetase